MRLSTVFDINWWATLRLGRACGKWSGYLCRGRVQMAVSPCATIAPPTERNTIGMPLLAKSTVRSAVTVLEVGAAATVRISGAMLGRGIRLKAGPKASLTIGKGSYVTDGSCVLASESISIGENCAISWNVTIIDDDGHGEGPPPYSRPVVIEDHVWIGCNAVILKGVTIGAGSIVGAGAVVTRSCPPRSLLVGAPAKVAKSGVQWKNPADSGR